MHISTHWHSTIIDYPILEFGLSQTGRHYQM
jgi:hypothetical protein